MIETTGPIYFLTYKARDGLKRLKIQISPKRIDPRREALEILPLLIRRLSKKDKTAANFRVEEVVEFRMD